MPETTLYPTANPYDIPELAGLGEPAIQGPVMAWGSLARETRMAGTWAFYVDDYRFAALAKRPLDILATGCVAACEVNFTSHDTTPRAEIIWQTYRKRAIARAWQDAGLAVRVDLNVPHTHMDLCLLGVPRGWRAWSTRGYASRLRELEHELDVAREHGGELASVLVYGGGKPVRAVCESRPWARFVPAHMDRYRDAATRRLQDGSVGLQ